MSYGAPFKAWVLEELAPRPLVDMPRAGAGRHGDQRRQHLRREGAANELRTRMQMTDVVNRRKMRHAHMVNIDSGIMLRGHARGLRRGGSNQHPGLADGECRDEIRATTAGGHRYNRSLFSSNLKWLKTSGIISPHKWGNLPGGETFTAPARVDGTFVIDGVVGDYLCEKYGDLRELALDDRCSETTGFARAQLA